MQTIVGRRPYISGFSLGQAIQWYRHASALIGEWRERARQRQSLARLDDRLLADIGLLPEQRTRECAKRFGR
jgi:uncharacterized protein YjiS (DUF1127 family)